MADIRLLARMSFENLPWDKARVEIIARFLLLLAPIQAVNFSTLAHAISASAQIEPNYKRLRRFSGRLGRITPACRDCRRITRRALIVQDGVQ
jgi:hypothetical protein